jgi:hypothetical protein
LYICWGKEEIMVTIVGHTKHGSKKADTTGRKKKAVAKSGIPDLSNDPYFVKKAESAKRLLDKYGTPKK